MGGAISTTFPPKLLGVRDNTRAEQRMEGWANLQRKPSSRGLLSQVAAVAAELSACAPLLRLIYRPVLVPKNPLSGLTLTLTMVQLVYRKNKRKIRQSYLS